MTSNRPRFSLYPWLLLAALSLTGTALSGQSRVSWTPPQRIANLELIMPLRINQGKRDRMGERQKALAHQLRIAGLLR